MTELGKTAAVEAGSETGSDPDTTSPRGRRPSPPLIASLGTELRRRRQALRLTLGQVAKRAKISISLLSMIETGHRTASTEILAAVKDTLGIVDRLAIEPALPPPPAELAARLGGMLVVLTEAPIAKAALALGVGVGEVRRGLQALDRELSRFGIRVIEDGYVARLAPDPSLHDLVSLLTAPRQLPPLTMRQLESLVVVIVNGEVPRKFVEEARGVDSAEALSALVERGYLACRVDDNAPGRPLLYRPTMQAVERCGARSLEELQAQFYHLKKDATTGDEGRARR